MAKKLRDEDLILNIIINGNKSKKEMNELERAITDTNREINQLKKVQTDLATQDKKNTEAYRAATTAIKAKEAAITLAEGRLSQLRSGMKLTEMSITDLTKEQTKLNKLWKMSTPGSENAVKYREQLDAVKARLAEVDDKGKKTGNSLEGMGSKFSRSIGAISAGVVSLMAVITGLYKINEVFAAFDDKIADVQKTTGMARTEVMGLNEELKKIDTRTQQEDLLGLARVAGKLGITGKDDVLGFVRATDQIGVALTEDLGGDIEESINQIGKLVEIFNLKDQFGIEKSLLKVGSTINELGANSSANEGYVVEFAKRVAGVAPAAGISIQNILGLAATLDQLGQTAEVSGTTFNDVIPSMFKDTATFAHAAGMELGAFTELLNRDTNEAFIKVLEGIKGNNAGFGEMVIRLNSLGVDGTRTMNVMNALAGKTGILREQQLLANQSFAAGTSLTNEYNIKNQTAAANLDRVKKAIYNVTVELGEKLSPTVTSGTSLFVGFIKALATLASFLLDHGRLIVSLTLGYVAYTAVIKAKVAWEYAEIAALYLKSAAYKLLRLDIAGASAEMAVFNILTKANPIGMLLAVLVAAGYAMYSFSTRIKDVYSEMNKLSAEFQEQKQKVQELNNQTKPLIDRFEELKGKAKLNKDEQAELKKVIGQIAAAIPNAVKQWDQYGNALDINATKAREYIEVQKALLKETNKTTIEATKRAIIEKEKEQKELIKLYNKGKITQSTGGGGSTGMPSFITRNLSSKEKADLRAHVANIAKEIQQSKLLLKGLTGDYLNIDPPKKTGAAPKSSGFTEQLTADQLKARQKYALEAKSQIDQEKVAHEARLIEVGLFGKAKEKMTQEDLTILADLEKIHRDNISSINSKSNKKAISEQAKHDKEAQALLEQQAAYRLEVVNSQKTAVEQENIAHQDRLKKASIDENKIRKDQVLAFEALEKIHKANLNKLDAEAITKHLDAIQKKYDKDLSELKIRNNTELASVTTLEQAKLILKDSLSQQELDRIRSLDQAKKALQLKFQQDENKLTEKQLNDLTALLSSAFTSGDFAGLKLSDHVFSQEELDILSERLGVAKEKLAEIIAKQKEPGSSDKEMKGEYSFSKGKTDILGLTAEDWQLFTANLEAGKLGIGEMAAAVMVLSSAWSIYSDYVTATENKNLKNFEKATDEKKTKLSNQLDSGRISQERYNAEVKKIDEDLDKKKLEIEEKQAKRQKTSALLNIAQSTAQAIMGIWAQVPKFDFGISAGVLTGVVSALGAAQAAVVLAGKEEGGFLDVEREQDGKRFRAKNSPGKRGYVGQTSVIVSENGKEFVASAQAVDNPSIRPVLDILDTAQRNGTISTLNLENIMSNYSAQRAYPGRQSGGFISSRDDQRQAAAAPGTDPLLLHALNQANEINKQLLNQLKHPIKADVSLLGKTGLIAKQSELERLQKGGNL